MYTTIGTYNSFYMTVILVRLELVFLYTKQYFILKEMPTTRDNKEINELSTLLFTRYDVLFTSPSN